MFCPHCGNELPDEAKFCARCGQSVEIDESFFAPEEPQANPSNAASAAGAAAKPAFNAETVNDKLNEIQCKIDNSNAKVIKGRRALDVIGLVCACVMALCFFLPVAHCASFGGKATVSIFSMMVEFSNSSYLSGAAFLCMTFLFPIALAFVDLLMTENNSSRHVRLICTSVLNIIMLASLRSIFSLLNSLFSVATMSVGFYLSILASIALIVVEAYEIYLVNKSNNQ